MKYKDGVVFWGKVSYNGTFHLVELKEEMQYAAREMDQISREETNNEIIIVSAIEGKHSPTSKHPEGLAIDVRSWIYRDAEKQVLLRRWNMKLNPDWDYDTRKGKKNYDIILENPGEKNEHFHIEYDPR